MKAEVNLQTVTAKNRALYMVTINGVHILVDDYTYSFLSDHLSKQPRDKKGRFVKR